MAVDEFHQTGGTLDGAAKLSAAKVMSWSGGTMQGTGVTAALAGSMATITAGTLNTRLVALAGTTDWDGSIGGGGGRIENSGYLRVGGVNHVGTATLAGTYAQTGTGKLELDLGSAPVGGHDTLFASENLTLGGELSLIPSAGSANVPALEPKHYSLVRNTGPNATTGVFASHANGQRVVLLGWKYDYSDRYIGDGDGRGNDVHLSPAPGSIGDRIWLDGHYVYNDGAPVPNPLPLGNGVQDPGEYGYTVASVRLLGADGNVVAVTTPDGSGGYGFGNVAPWNSAARSRKSACIWRSWIVGAIGCTSPSWTTRPASRFPAASTFARRRASRISRMATTTTSTPTSIPGTATWAATCDWGRSRMPTLTDAARVGCRAVM